MAWCLWLTCSTIDDQMCVHALTVSSRSLVLADGSNASTYLPANHVLSLSRARLGATRTTLKALSSQPLVSAFILSEGEPFVWQNAAPVSSGEQIYDSYGRKCNWRFFVNYGFCLEENEDNQVTDYCAFGALRA